jgi:glycosyltransferase involved in cell wall biosynthesis
MGGSIIAAAQIASTSHGEGIESVIAGTVVRDSGTEKYFTEQYPTVAFRAFDQSFPKRFLNSAMLRRWLRTEARGFDAIHVHGFFNFPYLYAGRSALRNRRPLVLSAHNSLDPYDLRKKALLKRCFFGPVFVRPLLAGARCVMCTTELEAARLVTYNVTPEPPRVVVPLPVPPPRPMPRDNEWRRRHNIPNDACVVLFLSRFDQKKGLDLLVMAMARIAQPHPGAILAIAGGGDDLVARNTRDLVQLHRVGDRVRWLGFLTGDAKRQAYDQCDIFALPSRNENFGLVVVEAMYAGKPLLISQEVYLRETLARYHCAQICETTVESVATALAHLLNDANLRRDMGLRAAAAATKEFAPAVVRKRLQNLYRDVCRPRSAESDGS